MEKNTSRTYRERYPMKKNSGTVLIFVLALSATLGAALVLAQSYLISGQKRFKNAFNHTEAYYLAISAHQLAHRALSEDLSSGYVDGAKDNWYVYHQKEHTYPIAKGTLTFQLEDATSKPNINQIYTALKKRDPLFLKSLKDYFNVNKIKTSLIPELRDWIDTDDTVYSSGAEKQTYLLNNPSYIPENAKMILTTDVKLLKSYTPSNFLKIQKALFALPRFEKTNINTVHSRWLKSLYPQISEADLKEFLTKRKTTPYTKVHEALTYLNLNKEDVGVEFDVSTPFFKLTSSAEIYGKVSGFDILYERKNGHIVVRRFQWH